MATEAEIAWAAGLFEGEGCFSRQKPDGKSDYSEAMEAAQRAIAEVLSSGKKSYTPDPKPAKKPKKKGKRGK